MPEGAKITGTIDQSQSPTRQKWLELLEPVILSTRDRAKVTHEKWDLFHKAWRGVHTRSFFKSDTFNHYLPATRLALESFVVRTSQMLVPSPEFFEVFPGTDVDSELGKGAESVRQWMMFLWSRRIKGYQFVRQLVRSYALYGRAIAKSTLRIDQGTMGSVIWPHARPVDAFLFYTWPEAVADLEDATCVFEDNMMPWEVYQEAVKYGLAESISQPDLTKPEWPTYSVRRLQVAGINSPTDTPQGAQPPTEDGGKATAKPMERFVALTESYWRERPGAWRRCWIVWNLKNGPRCVGVDKATRIRPPYRYTTARSLPGEAYETSMMDDLEPSQVLLNDQVNMTLEGHAMSFLPPAAVDPDLVTRAPSVVWKPRAKWLMKPEGLKWMEIPDTTANGYRGISFTMSFIQQATSSGGLASGQTTRNLPRGSFAVSSLMSMATADIRDAAQMIEDNILTPLLSDLFNLTMAHVPPTQIYRIPGTQNFPRARSIKAEELGQDWNFVWVGSLQAQDFQVRSQRLVAILGQLARLGPVIQADLQVRGKRINWTALLQRLWRDAAGERGADSIIEDIPPQEMLMMQVERMLQAIGSGQVKAAQQTKQAQGMGMPGEVPSPASTLAAVERQISEGSGGQSVMGSQGG